MFTSLLKKIGAGGLFFSVVIGFPRPCSAEPGNLISWSRNAPNELTFTCQAAVVKLDLLDTDVARVRVAASGVPFSTNASFTVIRTWPRPHMSVTDGSTLVVSTAGLRVKISKTPFRLTFCRPDGTVLLTDTNTSGLDSATANFQMPAGEQYYGLGLVLGQPLSYRGQPYRLLYNERAGFQGGAMTDMAVPLVVSSHGYGVFVDNTYPQEWEFANANNTQWAAFVFGGELNYYFIAGGTPAAVLDQYTLMTGRAPVPPRWALGYIQSKYGYENWGQVFAARDGFRTNDLPCDALALDLYWYGGAFRMGALTWYTNNFPNAASNLTALAGTGIKVMNIQEEYINRDNAPASTNFAEAAAAHYLVATDAAMTSPSIMQNPGFYGNAGYMDFLNPAARSWFFGKLQPIINDGVAAHWTDLGEPEEDNWNDYLFGGRSEFEIHNVYNLLWHQGLAEGYAAHYPNQRLYILSRSGFAGDQRFGAAHWSNDTAANWPTLAAHPTALCNYGFSGMSYFGSDIGGFSGLPSDELYVRWFQFGAFCPVFRAHGTGKPVAPYEFDEQVKELCRYTLKLRYRLLPYIYTVARQTFDTGLPMCRALPLAFPGDTNSQTNGNEFMFGPNILVAPVTTQGATSCSVYLPAGTWIDHWTGQKLTGPQTITNWPTPLSQIPLFHLDNSITPLGPYVASSQFDDGTQRGLRIYCDSAASYKLYEDDGISTAYLSGQFATTTINATASSTPPTGCSTGRSAMTHGATTRIVDPRHEPFRIHPDRSADSQVVTVNIGGAVGTYAGQPVQRTWGIELYCTNALYGVTADGISLNSLPDVDTLAAAASGYYLDGAEHLVRIKLPLAPTARSHQVQVRLNLFAPPPCEVRVKAVSLPYLDHSGATWAQDCAYTPGGFGFSGGSSNVILNAIAGTDDALLYQSERIGPAFSYLFDVPNGVYEIQLLDAETDDNSVGDRVMNVFIGGRQVLTNFDILAAAGGKNIALSLTFTNTVANGQLAIAFAAVAGHTDPNARLSAIDVRKIADPDSDGDGIPDWWTQLYFGHPTGQAFDHSLAQDSAAGDGVSNLQKYLLGKNPLIWDNLHVVGGQCLSNGRSNVTIFGQVGHNYTLQASTDLVNWVPVLTFGCTNAKMDVPDPTAMNFVHRFYRLVSPPSVTGMIIGPGPDQPFDGEGFNLVLMAPPGLDYRIDASSDLVTWTMLTNFFSTNAATYLIDPEATNYHQRFYRAVAP